MNKDAPLILIVDDEQWNVAVLESYLYGRGYRIAEATNGHDALELVGQEPPDLILLDVMMPGMDGFEVCRRLKADERAMSIPVVMVTALDHKLDRIAAITAGADDFITKPVDKAELVARVRSLLKIKLYHDELEVNRKETLELQILKDNLLHTLVRDFKDPLMSILYNLEAVSANTMDRGSEDCDQRLSHSLYLARKMSSLIGDLMDLTPLERDQLHLHPEKVMLREMVNKGILELSRAFDERGIKAVLTEDASDVMVNADKALLSRVIGNVLENAARHSPDDRPIAITISSKEGVASLSIIGHGPTILPYAVDAAFERRYNAESRTFDNKGIASHGLVFCAFVIKAHGGDIKAVDNPDGGSKFIITLPAL